MATDDEVPPPKDVKVKQLLAGESLDAVVDAATQRELARWFGLPSFAELAEQPVAPEDPELQAVRERRVRVAAEVDPALLERIRQRTEVIPETLIKFEALIDVRVDPDIALFDHGMVDRAHSIADPREVEISEQLRDDLKEVTPQALLRDLHRSEREFEKVFELVDMAAEQRLDIVETVATAMATNWKLPPLDKSPYEEERRKLAEDRAIRRRPWIELPMPRRRVTE